MKPRTITPLGNEHTPPHFPPAPATIGFRLDDASRKLLGERAARLKISPHELARDYLIEMLNPSPQRTALDDQTAANEREVLWAALNGLHERMIDLRRDLVLVAEGIIVATGAMDKQGARAWTKKCFP